MKSEQPGGPLVFVDSRDQAVYYYHLASDPRQPLSEVSSDNPGGPDLARYICDREGRRLVTDFVLMTKGPDGLWGSRDPADGGTGE